MNVVSARKEAPRHVLVVEDDAFLRAVTVEYLQDYGFPVMQAGTADEAVALLQADQRIGVVFSDIQMPGEMDGIELATWIREARPGVKVLLTSGRAVPDSSKPYRFVAKPYGLEIVAHQLLELADA